MGGADGSSHATPTQPIGGAGTQAKLLQSGSSQSVNVSPSSSMPLRQFCSVAAPPEPPLPELELLVAVLAPPLPELELLVAVLSPPDPDPLAADALLGNVISDPPHAEASPIDAARSAKRSELFMLLP